jgi:hypothetical protein
VHFGLVGGHTACLIPADALVSGRHGVTASCLTQDEPAELKLKPTLRVSAIELAT